MSTYNEPLVYVLTPVYNGESDLTACIESLRAQTYKNFRHVIVNNRSSDRTEEIAQRFAAMDPRVEVHTNDTFVGLMENHNIAFRHTPPEAKYCKILSGDDLLFPDYLRLMVAAAERNPTAGFVGCYQIAGTRIRWQGFPYPRELIDGRELCRQMFSNQDPNFGFGTPTSMLFRADLVRRTAHFYPTNYPHADTSVCYRYLHECDFAFVYQVLCMERLSPVSATPKAQYLREEYVSVLDDLLRYGKNYYSSEEYEVVLKALSDRYYEILVADVMGNKGKDFLDYHKQRMAEMGIPLKSSTLLRAAAKKLGSEALNPAHFLGKVRRRLSKAKVRIPSKT